MKATEASCRLPEEVATICHSDLPENVLWSEQQCHCGTTLYGTRCISAHFIGSVVYVEKGLYQVSSQSPRWSLMATATTTTILELSRHLGDTEPLRVLG